MPYYVAVHPRPDVRGGTVWRIDDREAVRVDAQQGPYAVEPGTVAPNFKFSDLPGWKYYPMRLEPGQFYPRIARPPIEYLDESPGISPEVDNGLVQSHRGKLAALREQLEAIFRTVHPVSDNFEAYGHDIRNLLILAATEVETHWKGLLKANGAAGENTNDYVRVLPALKLSDYAIELPFYPWLGKIRPFENWNPKEPTKSLLWYDSYNAVKHDREEHFKRATLLNALRAVSAVAIMNYAQFGLYADNRDVRSFFSLVGKPTWDPSEAYAIRGPNIRVRPVAFPF